MNIKPLLGPCDSYQLEPIKRLLSYSQETGKFTWCAVIGNRAKVGEEAGSIISSGVIRIKVNRHYYLASRLAWAYIYGVFPAEDEQVDHINGNTRDNRISNLRLVTPELNARNKSLYANNKSGCPGVSFSTAHGKWLARIGIGKGKKKHLGFFTTKEEAIAARQHENEEHSYHPNHGRNV